VRMISTIHDATIVDKRRKDMKRNMEIKDVMVQVWKDKTCANDKYDP
jgi:hypothetical protein